MKVTLPKPVFVTPHAMSQFRERVAALPDADIITIIMASLQSARPFCLTVRDHRLVPLYRLRWRGIEYTALLGPPAPDKGRDWPMVITILEPHMMPAKIIPYNGGEWTWQDQERAGHVRKQRHRRRHRSASPPICSMAE